MVNHVDLTWKFVLAYVAYEFVSLVLFLPSNTPGVFFLLAIVNFFVLLWGCRWSVKFGTVRDGAAELARGNLEYRIDTRHLPGCPERPRRGSEPDFRGYGGGAGRADEK